MIGCVMWYVSVYTHVIYSFLLFHRFGMYRSGVPFERLTGPYLRVYAPYAAVHVYWYDDSENLPKDKVYYKSRQSGVNNW